MNGRSDKVERLKQIDFSIQEISRRGHSLVNRDDIEKLQIEKKTIESELRRS